MRIIKVSNKVAAVATLAFLATLRSTNNIVKSIGCYDVVRARTLTYTYIHTCSIYVCEYTTIIYNPDITATYLGSNFSHATRIIHQAKLSIGSFLPDGIVCGIEIDTVEGSSSIMLIELLVNERTPRGLDIALGNHIVYGRDWNTRIEKMMRERERERTVYFRTK